MVHHVKEFGAKLECPGLFEAERFVRGEINVLNSRETDRVGAGRSSKRSELCRHERSRIEPVLPSALIPRQIAVLARNEVGARADACTRGVHAVDCRRRKAAL